MDSKDRVDHRRKLGGDIWPVVGLERLPARRLRSGTCNRALGQGQSSAPVSPLLSNLVVLADDLPRDIPITLTRSTPLVSPTNLTATTISTIFHKKDHHLSMWTMDVARDPCESCMFQIWSRCREVRRRFNTDREITPIVLCMVVLRSQPRPVHHPGMMQHDLIRMAAHSSKQIKVLVRSCSRGRSGTSLCRVGEITI